MTFEEWWDHNIVSLSRECPDETRNHFFFAKKAFEAGRRTGYQEHKSNVYHMMYSAGFCGGPYDKLR